MIIFLYIILVIIDAVLVFGLILFIILGLDSIIRGHDLLTSRRATGTIYKIIAVYGARAKTFYDLGCSRGWLAVQVKKQFPQLAVYGLDMSRLRLFFAKLRAFLFGQKIYFRQADVLKADLREADIVYTYLWYDHMPPLEKKLRGELCRGAVVVTNTSHFPTWEPRATYVTHPENPDFEKLFVYVKDG